MRVAPSTTADLVLRIEAYVPVAIYWSSVGEIYNGSTTWYYSRVSYGVPSQTYYGWIHSTLIDATQCQAIPDATLTPTTTPTASNTSTPSNTPTPSNTLTATNTPPPDLSSVFPLPMLSQDALGSPLTGNPPIRLSVDESLFCGFGGLTILSRDINPRNVGGDVYPTSYHPVVLPAPAMIMVVDQDIEPETEYNKHLGNFVAIRILMEDIPLEIQDRLQTINIGPDQSFKNINVAQGGSILIGFAHRDSIAAEVVPGAALPTGTIIGISGKTGGDYIPHLDVSAFYVPDNPRAIRMDYLPPIPDYLAPDGRPFEYSYNAYFTMY